MEKRSPGGVFFWAEEALSSVCPQPRREALRFNGAARPKRFGLLMGGSASRRGQCFQRGALRFNWVANLKRFIGPLINQGSASLGSDRTGVSLSPEVEALPSANLSTEPERGSASFPSRLKRAKRSGSDGQQIGKRSIFKNPEWSKRFVRQGSQTKEALRFNGVASSKRFAGKGLLGGKRFGTDDWLFLSQPNRTKREQRYPN